MSNCITTIDTHTMGEPTRVVTAGIGPVPGRDMAAKKKWFLEHKDHIRRLLLWEPRGHRDMFGAVLTEPTRAEADIGVLFMDSGGCLDMCGHGSMGAVAALLEAGIIPRPEAPEPVDRNIVLDTPAGLIPARARIQQGRCRRVTIRNQPAFWYDSVQIPLHGRELPVDIVYGGNFFGLVDIESLGLDLESADLNRLTALALELRGRLNRELRIIHPASGKRGEVALIEFYQAGRPPKNVVIFGSGQVDRSPCGTGTCAKMALLHKKGRLAPGRDYIQQGILGTRFSGSIVREIQVASRPAIIPEISGQAFITGYHRFVIDPDDPFQSGFLLPV
ncbi:MAG: proline racemase family protein [Thermodesulfobacteriota bacterium]